MRTEMMVPGIFRSILVGGGLLLLSSSMAVAGGVSGAFGGELEYRSACEGGNPPIRGKIGNGRVVGVAARKKEFDWALNGDGTFEGELVLRRHKSGKNKMQRYEGRVEGNTVVIEAEYGVPGIQETFCWASGTFELIQ